MKKFRPIQISNKARLKHFLHTGIKQSYNFVSNDRYYLACYTYNLIFLHRVFIRLHYLACHAPNSIQKKYKPCYNRFNKIHFPIKASINYSNTYSLSKYI